MAMSDQEMLTNLKRLADELGRTPTNREVNACKYCPYVATYKKHFGSFKEAIVAAGLKAHGSGRTRKSNEEMLEDLNRLCEELGRIPDINELDECKYCHCHESYCSRFGGLKNALKLIGAYKKYKRKRVNR